MTAEPKQERTGISRRWSRLSLLLMLVGLSSLVAAGLFLVFGVLGGGSDYEGPGTAEAFATTASDGRFRVTVLPSEAALEAKVGSATLSFPPVNDDLLRRSEPDNVLLKYVPFQVRVPTSGAVDNELDCGTVTLERGIVLRGRVLDTEGQPVRVTALPLVPIRRDSTDFSPHAGRYVTTDAEAPIVGNED